MTIHVHALSLSLCSVCSWPFHNASDAAAPALTQLRQFLSAFPRNTAPSLPGLAPVMPWGAAIDNSTAGLLDLPLTLMQQGKFAKVPVILGTNLNEGTQCNQ